MSEQQGMFVVLIVLQGRPLVITNDETGDPHVWPTFKEAMDFTVSGHMGVTAAEQVLIIDCDTGETEVL